MEQTEPKSIKSKITRQEMAQLLREYDKGQGISANIDSDPGYQY